MEKIKLGNSDILVNPLCLGTGSFGGTVHEAEAIEQLDHYRALGGSFLDTAVVYCDWYEGERSSSQHYLGRWLESRGCRKEFTLSVKGCNADVMKATNHMGTAIYSGMRVGKQYIKQDIQRSMENLRTDYLDIFTLHKDDESVEIGEILETLQEQKNKGAIRAYGCSNWRPVRQQAALAFAREHGLDGFSVDQTRWCLNAYAPGAHNDGEQVMTKEAYRFHRESGIPVMAYGAAGRGYFQRLSQGMEIRHADHAEYDCPKNQAIFALLNEISQVTGEQMGTLTISYLLMDHGFQTIPLFSVKSLPEMDMCFRALTTVIPEEYGQKLRELRALD